MWPIKQLPTFYHKEKKCLIFVPLRCGSTVFERNKNVLPVRRLDGVPDSDIDLGLSNEIVKTYLNNLDTRHYVIFRDPLQRILSYFHSFVYVEVDVKETKKNINSELFWETFIDWLPVLRENMDDPHVHPIAGMLRQYEIPHRLHKFTIVPNRHYAHFLENVVGFENVDKNHTHHISNYNFNASTLPIFLEAYSYIKEIYAEDYEIMKKATYEWKNLYVPESKVYKFNMTKDENGVVIARKGIRSSDEENFYEDFSPPEDEIPVYEPEDLPPQHREEIDAPIEEEPEPEPEIEVEPEPEPEIEIEVEPEPETETPVPAPVVRTTNTNRRRRRNR